MPGKEPTFEQTVLAAIEVGDKVILPNPAYRWWKPWQPKQLHRTVKIKLSTDTPTSEE